MKAKPLRIVLTIAAAVAFAGVAVVSKETDPRPKKKDPFVGRYVGMFDPVGVTGQDGKVADRPKCGSCHALAEIKREKDNYLLTLTVKRAKGDRKLQFDGERKNGKVVFRKSPYTITAEKGKLTGDRKGKMVAKIALIKGSKATTKPKPKPKPKD